MGRESTRDGGGFQFVLFNKIEGKSWASVFILFGWRCIVFFLFNFRYLDLKFICYEKKERFL